jgi:SET domain-containing protein
MATPGSDPQSSLVPNESMMETAEPGYEIRKVPNAGRGVFSTRLFRIGEVISRDPVLLLDIEDWRHGEKTILNDYVFMWPDEETPMAVSLGVGSLFNTSSDQNIKFKINVEKKTIIYTAIKLIRPGDEMLIDYDWETEKMDPCLSG